MRCSQDGKKGKKAVSSSLSPDLHKKSGKKAGSNSTSRRDSTPKKSTITNDQKKGQRQGKKTLRSEKLSLLERYAINLVGTVVFYGLKEIGGYFWSWFTSIVFGG